MKRLKLVISVMALAAILSGCGTSPSYKVVKPGVDLSYVPIWENLKGYQVFRYNSTENNPTIFLSDKDTAFAKQAKQVIAKGHQPMSDYITFIDTFMQTSDPTQALAEASRIDVGQSVSVLAADPKDYKITQTPAMIYFDSQHNPQVIIGDKAVLNELTKLLTVVNIQ